MDWKDKLNESKSLFDRTKYYNNYYRFPLMEFKTVSQFTKRYNNNHNNINNNYMDIKLNTIFGEFSNYNSFSTLLPLNYLHENILRNSNPLQEFSKFIKDKLCFDHKSLDILSQFL